MIFKMEKLKLIILIGENMKLKNKLLNVMILSIVTLVFTYIFLDLKNADINVPFYLNGDSLFMSYVVKTLGNFGWWFKNPNVGAPFGGDLYDFTAFHFDAATIFIIKILIFFTGNWIRGLNMFIILLFPITSVISYFVMKEFKVSNFYSILGSVTYTFLPYRFLRLATGHLFIAVYYTIPLAILILYWLYNDNISFNLNKSFLKERKNICALMYLIFISLSGVYYLFFFCFLILIVFFIKYLNKKKAFQIIKNISIVYIIVAVIMLGATIPYIINNSVNGKNSMSVKRSPIESEIYGMKITQLYIPNNISKIKFLKDIQLNYQNAPLPNEGSEYLGLIGLIGFTILIINIFKKHDAKDDIYFLSRINIGAVLLGIIGGYGSIFSLTVSSQLRGYNRISIYIAYLSILTSVIYFDNVSKKFKKNKIFYNFIIAIIFIVGLFEQIPKNTINHIENKKKYTIDRKFIEKIEKHVSNGGMIFQLPYYRFPESPPMNEMNDYELFKGYLYSEKLKWSYGGFKNRKADIWNNFIIQLPNNEMIELLSLAGFEGIYIDKRAYLEEDYRILEKFLRDTLELSPIISENNYMIFFSMNKFNDKVRRKYTLEELDRWKTFVLNTTLQFDGFYQPEENNLHKWIWSNSSSSIKIKNYLSNRQYIKLKMKIYTGYLDDSNLIVELNGLKKMYKINSEGLEIIMDIQLESGENIIKLSTDAEKINAPNDLRELYFRIEELKLESI